MRKILCLLLVMVMCFSLALTGCKKPAETDPAATTAATVASTTPTAAPTAAPTDATEETPTEDETPIEESTKASTKSTVAMPSRPAAPSKTTKATATKPAATTTKATTTKATAAPTEPPTQAPTTQPTSAPTKAPTTPSTAAPTTRPTRPSVAPDAWKEDNTLKILAVGNSYSIDCMQNVYEIAKAAGVENVKLGNLYIAGCALDTHLENARFDGIGYTFYTNSEGKWNSKAPYQMATAIQSDNWDFILFQQASPVSGYANTYDDLEALIEIVEPLCTNKNVQFAWHMTWAYKTGSTNGAFKNYANDQNVMYSAITNAVKLKIVTNPDITKVIPNGTAIQNARTSYVGDNFTRDNSDHLSYEQGRKIAGLGVVASLIDIDWDTIDLSSVISDEAFRQVAIESVQNAVKNPYTVTQSTHK